MLHYYDSLIDHCLIRIRSKNIEKFDSNVCVWKQFINISYFF